MSVTRGGLTYTIPNPVTPGVSKPIADTAKTFADIILLNVQEFLGLNSVWLDPVISIASPTNGAKAAVPDSSKYKRRVAYANADVDAVRTAFCAGSVLSVNAINNLINTYRWYESTGKNLVTTLNNETFDAVPGQGAKGVIDDGVFNAIATNMNKISEHLNGYDSWWNGDLCARTCQINCQTACQIACQGCNNSTCHNQNCGGFS